MLLADPVIYFNDIFSKTSTLFFSINSILIIWHFIWIINIYYLLLKWILKLNYFMFDKN